jgi:hypothetical protein
MIFLRYRVSPRAERPVRARARRFRPRSRRITCMPGACEKIKANGFGDRVLARPARRLFLGVVLIIFADFCRPWIRPPIDQKFPPRRARDMRGGDRAHTRCRSPRANSLRSPAPNMYPPGLRPLHCPSARVYAHAPTRAGEDRSSRVGAKRRHALWTLPVQNGAGSTGYRRGARLRDRGPRRGSSGAHRVRFWGPYRPN